MDTAFLTNKLGPMPVWGWVGVGIAGLYIFQSRKNSATANAATGTAGLAGTSAANLPNGTAFDPQDLTVVNEGYNPPSITINNPATGPVAAPAPPVISRTPTPVVKKPTPVKRPAPVKAKAPGRWVTVTPWNTSNPWSSTLSGIAQHYYNNVGEDVAIAKLNGIKNMNLIHTGQRIYLP